MMPSYVIKPDRDRDQYVYWSTVVEAPLFSGTRAETAAYLSEVNGAGDGGRLDRADKYGTSCLDVGDGIRFYDWTQDCLIYDQRGTVKRSDLWELCERIGRDQPVDDLIQPFTDDEADHA